MSDSLTTTPESAFVCDCEESARSACAGEPFYQEHEGKRYCVFHFPGNEKSDDFDKALQRKLENKDFNFRGVWFSDPASFFRFEFDGEVHFQSAIFRAEADFSEAIFNAQADFGEATFKQEAFFSYVDFKGPADFHFADFDRRADFSEATFFAEADFNAATFTGDADFIECLFTWKADFSNVTFKDYVKFAGNETTSVFGDASSLDLRFARIEKPDHFSFHTVTLRSHWFANVDARKFEFINVKWLLSTGQEIENLNIPTENKVRDSGQHGLGAATYELLAIAFRNLAVNAEENHRYEEASKFRYKAMDAHRRDTWRGFVFWRLSWWYWLASGYGERAAQAFFVLLGMMVLSALLYTQVGFVRWEPRLASESDVVTAKRDEVGAPLPLARALGYSAGVITFQKPEPRPATPTAQAIVLIETILGPVQAALLALAIRRKFMR